MIYPVTAYGHPVLRKMTDDIDKNYPDLGEFIDNMWETMYFSDGIGLAAPQVNSLARVFIVDVSAYADEIKSDKPMKQAFINPHIVEESGDEWLFNEGCLSIPGIREDVSRKEKTRIRYYDRNWEYHDEWFDGIQARVIQHEHDHLDGILFTDHLSTLRRSMLRNKLSQISKGQVKTDYKMIFPFSKKKKK